MLRQKLRPRVFNFLEPRLPLVELEREGDIGFPVVNLLTAEALIPSDERRTGQLSTGTVGRADVVVVCHSFPFVFVYVYYRLFTPDK